MGSSPEQSAARPGRFADTHRVRTAATSTARVWVELLRRAPAAARVTGLGHRGPGLSPVVAFGIVIGLWAIFFGAGVVNAVRVLVGDYAPAATPMTAGVAARDIARSFAETAAAIWLVTLLAYRCRFTCAQLGWPTAAARNRRLRPVELPDGLRLGLLYLAVLLAMSAGMNLLESVFGGAHYPSPPASGWPGVLSGLADSLAAGVIEELVLVAVLVTVLEAARQRTWVIYAAAFVVRVSFHLYYAGQEASGLISLLPMVAWAAPAVALFRWTRLVVPLMAAHALWDACPLVAYNTGPAWEDTVVTGLVLVMGLAAAGYAAWCAARQRRATQTELTPLIAQTAAVFGMTAPRLRLRGSAHPEVYRDRRGLVMRYDWHSARRHTEEQRRGWIAHALAHVQLGHEPRSASADRALGAITAAAVAAVLIPATRLLQPELLPPALPLVSAAAAVPLLAGLILGLRRWRRRRARTSWDRHALEIAADQAAADVVGTLTVRAAIATPNTYPSTTTPPAHALPARARRRAALEASHRSVTQAVGR